MPQESSIVCVLVCAPVFKNTRQSFIWNTYQQAYTPPIFRNAIFFHAETLSTDGKGNCLGERVAVAEKSKKVYIMNRLPANTISECEG